MRYTAECPNCQHEFDVNDTVPAEGLYCPQCQSNFRPERLNSYGGPRLPLPPAPSSSIPPLTEHQKEEMKRISERGASRRIWYLESRAERLTSIALGLALLGGLLFLIGLFLAAIVSEFPAALFGLCTALLSGALISAFFSHLYQIRVSLEKIVQK